MPDEHARLSPSASERWISCPASVRLSEAAPRRGSSVYATEGTAAHSLGELKAALALGRITDRQYVLRFNRWKKKALLAGLTSEQLDDMAEHTDDYAALILQRAALYPHSAVLLEQRVDTGVPSCWGTGDAVIVSSEHVEIIDLKYGVGVEVAASWNTQLMLYGVGALETFGDLLGEPKLVRMTIFQPRTHSLSTFELDADELRAWRDGLVPRAQSALDGSDVFGPGEKACRWCAVAGQCRAQMEWSVSLDFARPPDLLSPDELADVLGMLPAVDLWTKQVSEKALALAYEQGTPIPGWKVVLSGGRRTISDPDMAVKVLTDRGYQLAQVAKTSLRGLGELDRLLKPLPLEDVLGSLVAAPVGRPSLVPCSDKRDALDVNRSAVAEFS